MRTALDGMPDTGDSGLWYINPVFSGVCSLTLSSRKGCDGSSDDCGSCGSDGTLCLLRTGSSSPRIGRILERHWSCESAELLVDDLTDELDKLREIPVAALRMFGNPLWEDDRAFLGLQSEEGILLRAEIQRLMEALAYAQKSYSSRFECMRETKDALLASAAEQVGELMTALKNAQESKGAASAEKKWKPLEEQNPWPERRRAILNDPDAAEVTLRQRLMEADMAMASLKEQGVRPSDTGGSSPRSQPATPALEARSRLNKTKDGDVAAIWEPWAPVEPVQVPDTKLQVQLKPDPASPAPRDGMLVQYLSDIRAQLAANMVASEDQKKALHQRLDSLDANLAATVASASAWLERQKVIDEAKEAAPLQLGGADALAQKEAARYQAACVAATARADTFRAELRKVRADLNSANAQLEVVQKELKASRSEAEALRLQLASMQTAIGLAMEPQTPSNVFQAFASARESSQRQPLKEGEDCSEKSTNDVLAAARARAESAVAKARTHQALAVLL